MTVPAPGETRTFHSTMQGQDGNGHFPALYSGRECVVLGPVPDVDEDSEGMLYVRFTNGVELEVFVGEIDGWYFKTGQWFGPFAAVQDGCSPDTFRAVTESLLPPCGVARSGGKTC